MQLRMNDVWIDECPKFLHPNPTDTTHAIKFSGVDGEEDYVVPLALHGVTSYFPTRKPTESEWVNCQQLELTTKGPGWDPHDTQFSEQENALLDDSGQLRDFGDRLRRTRRFLSPIDSQNSRLRAQMISKMTSQCQAAVLNEIDSTVYDARFIKEWKSSIRVRMPKDSVAIFVASSERGKKVNAADLVKRWDIGLKTAEKTVEVTTQRGIKTLDNPMLNRRFRMNNRNLRYQRLGVDMYTDTLFAGMKSKRGNNTAQVFGTSFRWSRAYGMRSKGDAHEAYSILCSKVGVPDNIICDGAKEEQILGDFRWKCWETSCHVKQLEPYTPWENSAEGTIIELKKGSGRKMVKTKSPKVLWDDCLEYEAVLKSHTALNIYGLQGEVPKTVVTGQTTDILKAQYPDDKQKLARWLGPSFEVGSALCTKLLKENGQYACRMTCRGLTEDEANDPVRIKEMESFDGKILKKLGELADTKDFSKEMDVETPVCEPYEDDDDGGMEPLPDQDDANPEQFNNYVGSEVLLPHGDQMRSGKVVGRKRAADGTSKGNANTNPILDSAYKDIPSGIPRWRRIGICCEHNC
eukprot:scaffold159681_cov67-Attheya_sp.AAC.1